MNIDITDPIFKLPFEHGWRRELVFRTTGVSKSTTRSGDVYYYSPNNRKLGSLRDIQEQLNLSISDDNILTIDSFTFLEQPVGVDDPSKEIIRDANTTLSKEESFGIKSEKSTPDYVTEDWRAGNDSLSQISNSVICMQSFNYMVKAMGHVFMHLEVHELLTASRVCTAWNKIAMNKALWRNVRLKNSMVYDWKKCVDTINDQGTVLLDTRRMLIPLEIADFEQFWLRFCKDLKRAFKLKVILLYRCPTHVVEDIVYSLPQLEVLWASSIKNPRLTNKVKNTNDLMVLDLKYLASAENLTVLGFKGLSGIKLTEITSLNRLTHLSTLSMTSIKSFPKDINRILDSITINLECLEIGDCDCLTPDFAMSLFRLTNLKSLRLENCCGKFDEYSRDIFAAVRSLKNLRTLELINIEFEETIEEELGKCYGIRCLLIIPAYIRRAATTNCLVIDCLKKLSLTLTHLLWGLTHELLRVTDLFIKQCQENGHSSIGYREFKNTSDIGDNIPIMRTRNPKTMMGLDSTTHIDIANDVDILPVPSLKPLLETMMVCTKLKVIKIPLSASNRVHLTDHFNELNS